MGSVDRRAKRAQARKAARSGEVRRPDLTSSQVREGLVNLSHGVQEAFARVKKLQASVDDALEDLNARLAALEAKKSVKKKKTAPEAAKEAGE